MGINSSLVYIIYIPHQLVGTQFFISKTFSTNDDLPETSTDTICLVEAKANRRVRTVELDATALVSCEIEQPMSLLYAIRLVIHLT